MDSKFEELFEKWLDLGGSVEKAKVLAGLFGRMEFLQQEGSDADKAAAETFFEEFEFVLEEIR